MANEQRTKAAILLADEDTDFSIASARAGLDQWFTALSRPKKIEFAGEFNEAMITLSNAKSLLEELVTPVKPIDAGDLRAFYDMDSRDS